jgi:mRNA-degrading endonuclease RelE of RelBE toxin-antitoxin system
MPEVVYAESFLKAATRLQKRYKHVQDDAETLADQLEAGELPDDRIQGLSYWVYKARIQNHDAHRGKSGGYRVIYYLETAEFIVILSIYSKSDLSDIPTEAVRRLIV